jgi:hypothetical protein
MLYRRLFRIQYGALATIKECPSRIDSGRGKKSSGSSRICRSSTRSFIYQLTFSDKGVMGAIKHYGRRERKLL